MTNTLGLKSSSQCMRSCLYKSNLSKSTPNLFNFHNDKMINRKVSCEDPYVSMTSEFKDLLRKEQRRIHDKLTSSDDIFDDNENDQDDGTLKRGGSFDCLSSLNEQRNSSKSETLTRGSTSPKKPLRTSRASSFDLSSLDNKDTSVYDIPICEITSIKRLSIGNIKLELPRNSTVSYGDNIIKVISNGQEISFQIRKIEEEKILTKKSPPPVLPKPRKRSQPQEHKNQDIATQMNRSPPALPKDSPYRKDNVLFSANL